MSISKTGVNIGKAVAGRVRDFPVYNEEPKKKPKKQPTCWAICPDFRVRPPEAVDNEAGKKDYSFSILIFSETRKERDDALDHMIRCAQKEIATEDKRFWLYAVDYSLHHTVLFQAKLKYIFRVRQLPEEILKEVK